MIARSTVGPSRKTQEKLGKHTKIRTTHENLLLELRMGGTGSGERPNSKSTTSSCYQVDVRAWQRAGLLVAGTSFKSKLWSIDVAPYFDPQRKPDHAIFSVDSATEYIVRLEWTSCHYGGMRAWFQCPNKSCRRRVAILYSLDAVSLGCRHCMHLAYHSQQKSA